MKKVLTIVLLISIFLVIYFLQVNFFEWFTIAGIKPNLFVIYVLIISIFAGKKVGAPMGFFMGFYIDIINGRFIGISAVVLGVIGFLAEYMNKNVSNDNKITMMLIIAVNTVIYEVSYYILSMLKSASSVEVIAFIKILCVEIFFNIILTIVFYHIIQKFGKFLSETFKNKGFFSKTFVI